MMKTERARRLMSTTAGLRASALRPLSAAALFLSAACASNGSGPAGDDVASAPADNAPTIKASEARAPSGRPALWRVSDDDSEIFLFGTLHVLPPDVDWSSDIYEMSMRIADATITEADTKSADASASIKAAVQAHGLNPPGVTLSETLGAERAASLVALTDELGVPISALEPMRPWLALITLTQVLLQRAGFDPASGVEAIVLAAAEEQGDAIAHLETVSFQIETLAGLDHEEMLANFDTTIDQFADFEALTARLLEAWKTGDIAGLERDITAPLADVSPKAYDAIFTRRNAAWTAEIELLLEGSGNHFIAVGAGHLVGESNVIEMLENNGRRVMRLQ